MKKTFVSLIALAAAAPALAQTEPDTNAIEMRDESIVVIASRSGEGVELDRLGASATILDAQALELRQTRNVSDILRDVPGVAVSRAGPAGGITQVRIRGTEANHVLVLIDGIEAADPFQGEFDFASLIADPAARIEVLRGQQSSLYGSDAIGGVINYITLSGAEAPGFSARAEGGSFGTYTGAARFGGASESFDYAATATYYHTDGTPGARGGTRALGAENLALSGKINWTPTEAFKLSAVGRYSWADTDFNNSEYDTTSPNFGLPIDSPGVRATNRAFYGLVRAELTAFDGRWTNALTGQITDTVRKSYIDDFRDSGNKGQRYKGSFVSSFRFGSDTVVHRLTGAVDVERESFRNTTPSPFVFQGERDTDNIGIVGQYELQAGEHLSLGGSVRHDDNNRFADTTTWRVQGSYGFDNGTRLRAAYGTGVKNPLYYELFGYSDGNYIGNPDLKPEKSAGWEVGIEQSFGEAATIGATWFDSTLTDEVYITYLPPLYLATPANRATDSKQHGVEMFVSARPVPQIRLDASYTWTDSGENGVDEVRRPKHMASFNATVFSADQRFAGTLTVRYNGRMSDVAFTDPSYAPVTVAMQEFVLVNLNAEYAVSKGVKLFGRVENLFDERYEEVFGYATAGLGAYGGVRVGF